MKRATDPITDIPLSTVIKDIILSFKTTFTSDDVVDALIRRQPGLGLDRYILADVVHVLSSLMGKHLSFTTTPGVRVEGGEKICFTQIVYKVL